ncbi:MAG: hypothetical protein HRT74_07955, partial [Flavobacteriales bacterium]|nr:hypothetical protein [Flavobacteriales bacterium]
MTLKKLTLALLALVLATGVSFSQRNSLKQSSMMEMSAERTLQIQQSMQEAHHLTMGGGGDILGCTDLDACNFDPSANADDGSCCYSNCVGLQLESNLEVPFLQGGGGGGDDQPAWIISNSSGIEIASGTFNDSEFIELCLEDDCYTFTTFGGGYDAVSIFPISGIDIILAKNGGGGGGQAYLDIVFNPSNIGTSNIEFNVNSVCQLGCTNTSACNYDPYAFGDDGSCEFPGCNDSSACNYDPNAGCSADCIYPNACGECAYADGVLTGFGSFDESALVENYVPSPAFGAYSLISPDQVVVQGIVEVTGDGPGGPVLLGGGEPLPESFETRVAFEVPADGDYSFMWSYSTTDGAEYDQAFYAVNGVKTAITDENGINEQAGMIMVNLLAGDILT